MLMAASGTTPPQGGDVIPSPVDAHDVIASFRINVNDEVTKDVPLDETPPPSYTESITHETAQFLIQTTSEERQDIPEEEPTKGTKNEETNVLIDDNLKPHSNTNAIDVAIKVDSVIEDGKHSLYSVLFKRIVKFCSGVKHFSQSENTKSCVLACSTYLYVLLASVLFLLGMFVIFFLPGLICYLAVTYCQNDILNGVIIFVVCFYYTCLLVCPGSKNNK